MEYNRRGNVGGREEIVTKPHSNFVNCLEEITQSCFTRRRADDRMLAGLPCAIL